MLNSQDQDFDPATVPNVSPERRDAVLAAQQAREVVSRLLGKIAKLNSEKNARRQAAEKAALEAELDNTAQRTYHKLSKDAELAAADVARAGLALVAARRQSEAAEARVKELGAKELLATFTRLCAGRDDAAGQLVSIIGAFKDAWLKLFETSKRVEYALPDYNLARHSAALLQPMALLEAIGMELYRVHAKAELASGPAPLLPVPSASLALTLGPCPSLRTSSPPQQALSWRQSPPSPLRP